MKLRKRDPHAQKYAPCEQNEAAGGAFWGIVPGLWNCNPSISRSAKYLVLLYVEVAVVGLQHWLIGSYALSELKDLGDASRSLGV